MEIKPPMFRINEGYAANTWPKFKQCYEVYVSAVAITDEKQKCNLLLHCMGPEALDIYNTFEIPAAQASSFKFILEKFDYFLPKINITYERHKFFTRNQKVGENIDTYATELKALATTCNFDKLKDSLIKDRIVCGIQNNQLREKLLNETKLTLTKCMEVCRAFDDTKAQIKTLNAETEVNNVQVKPKRTTGTAPPAASRPSQSSSRPKMINKCTRCGYTH